MHLSRHSFLLALSAASTAAQSDALGKKYSLISYWGQNIAKNQFPENQQEASLKYFCQVSDYDIIHVTGVMTYNSVKGYPGIDLSKHCNLPTNVWKGWPEQTRNGFSLLNCSAVGKDIDACQKMGKKVVISINPMDVMSLNVGDAAYPVAVAKNIWDLFLGGASDFRPFGQTVALDGVDLHLWNNNQDGVPLLVAELRKLMGTYFTLSASPRCQFPDYIFNPTTFPNMSSFFNYTVPYFLGSPNICGYAGNNPAGFWASLDAWNTWLKPQQLPMYIGLVDWTVEAWAQAAGGDYISPTEFVAGDLVRRFKAYSQFSGFALQDASYDTQNVPCANDPVKAKRTYSRFLFQQLTLPLDKAGNNTAGEYLCLTKTLATPTTQTLSKTSSRPRGNAVTFANKTTTTTVLVASLLAPAFAEYKMISYWGQDLSKKEVSLATLCQTGPYDIIHLRGILSYSAVRSYPGVDFSSHCNFPGFGFQGWPRFSKNGLSLLNCEEIGKDIQTCQGLGKKVLISLDPLDSMTATVTNENATIVGNIDTVAQNIWDLFLGGQSPFRPFGDGVTVDGIDFHLWNENAVGVASLVSQIAEWSNKTFILAASPKCNFPNYIFNAQSFPNFTKTFDYVVPFFLTGYNGACAYNANKQGFWSTLNDWSKFAKKVPVYVGLSQWSVIPSVNAGPGDYISTETFVSDDIVPQLKKMANFAGFALIDEETPLASYENISRPCLNDPKASQRTYSQFLHQQLVLPDGQAGNKTLPENQCLNHTVAVASAVESISVATTTGTARLNVQPLAGVDTAGAATGDSTKSAAFTGYKYSAMFLTMNRLRLRPTCRFATTQTSTSQFKSAALFTMPAVSAESLRQRANTAHSNTPFSSFATEGAPEPSMFGASAFSEAKFSAGRADRKGASFSEGIGATILKACALGHNGGVVGGRVVEAWMVQFEDDF
ncbi:hypothetical protein HDU78_003650 [Chytriomyces hyalinus]|nr:hypothetical protein HDU78_003650 [Chytriomyces hyalinus]